MSRIELFTQHVHCKSTKSFASSSSSCRRFNQDTNQNRVYTINSNTQISPYTGEELYIQSSNGSAASIGGYSTATTTTTSNQHHQNNNTSTSTINVPSSLSVQQICTTTSTTGNGHHHHHGNGGSAVNNGSNSGGSNLVPHSQSAHEIGQVVPLTPLAQHQQALHHQLQLRFANANSNSSGESQINQFISR